MKLYITAPSPFARKCRIVAREKELMDRIHEIAIDPYASPDELTAVNPIAQAPALVTDDGLALSDSQLICEWLDAHGAEPRLLPAEGPDRWRVRQVETLASGALEMGVKRLLELRRPEAERSPSWIGRWTTNMARALDALETAALVPDPLDIGLITAGCAVTWIGFRHPDFDWKTGRPGLVELQAALEVRPSFRETVPT